MNATDLKLSENLNWIFDKEKFFLIDSGETIVELREEKSNKTEFVFKGELFTIHNRGFWNPMTTVKRGERTILILKRSFFGTKSKVEFASGESYTYKLKNSPLIELQFATADGAELLAYNLKAGTKPNSVESVLTMYPNQLPPFSLVLLIVLGFHFFRNVVIENNASDMLLSMLSQ